MRGTCMTTNECDDNGGTSDGNCAAGFGVCCMFTSTCSSSSTTNTISRVSSQRLASQKQKARLINNFSLFRIAPTCR